MKDYLITIKQTRIAKMMVNEESASKAIEKVSNVLKKSIENNVNLDKTFNQGFLSYKAKLIKKSNK